MHGFAIHAFAVEIGLEQGAEVAPRTDREQGVYIRSELQCILRLPEADAVVFSIHTRQVHIDDLSQKRNPVHFICATLYI